VRPSSLTTTLGSFNEVHTSSLSNVKENQGLYFLFNRHIPDKFRWLLHWGGGGVGIIRIDEELKVVDICKSCY
jgi:hypothetical protein